MSDTVELKDALVASQNQIDVFGTVAGKYAQGNDSRFPTSDEKAALVGTSGTPGIANRYVTSNDSRLSDSRDPNKHGNEAHSTNYEPELNADQKRKITFGTADPSGGSDGDIYMQYEL